MHIFQIDRPEGLVVQGTVRLRIDPVSFGLQPPHGRDGAWGHLRVALRGLAMLPALSRYIAVSTELGGEITLTVSAVCETLHKAELKKTLAVFFRMDGLADISVVSPNSPEGFTSDYQDHAARRLSISTDYSIGNLRSEVLLPLRLFDLLGTAIRMSRTMETDFRYECTLVPQKPDPELIRSIRYAAAGLTNRSVPDKVASKQNRLSAELAHATTHAKEAISAPDSLIAAIEEEAVRTIASDPLYAAGYRPSMVLVNELDAEAFGYLVHPAILEPGATLDSNSFLDDAERLDRLLLDPVGKLLGVTDAALAETKASALLSPQVPLTTGTKPDAPFLFLSYARADQLLVDQFLRHLRGAEIIVWTDAQIQAADEWDAVLERQIHEASAVFCIVTAQFVKSKYCRREIKYADALDKPILAVLDEETELTDGLAMIFSSCQYLPMGNPKTPERLIIAARDTIKGAIHE